MQGGVRRPRVGFVIAFGPELRAFVYSGLVRAVAELGSDPVLLPIERSLPFLPSQVGVVALPGSQPSRLLMRLWDFNEVINNARFGTGTGTGDRWRHLPTGLRRTVWKRAAIGTAARMKVVQRVLAALETWIRQREGCRSLGEILGPLGFDALVLSGYSAPRLQPLIGAAESKGLPIVVLTNSWKDVQVRHRVPFRPALLGVWHPEDRAAVLRYNPNLPRNSLHVTGSLHLAALKETPINMSRAAWCAGFGLDPRRPVACYSAASPQAVPREGEILRKILLALQRVDGGEKVQVIIRGNPMGGKKRFEPLLGAFHDAVVYQEPDWEWDPEADWCAPRRGDLPLWRATIEYSFINISVASTVTLEWAMLGRPVFNVLFDHDGAVRPESGTARYWEAPFYAVVRELGLARAAKTPEEVALAAVRSLQEQAPAPVDVFVADLGKVARFISAIATSHCWHQPTSRFTGGNTGADDAT